MKQEGNMESLKIQLPSKTWCGGNLEPDMFSSTFYFILVAGKDANNELYHWLHLVMTHLLFSKAYSILPLNSHGLHPHLKSVLKGHFLSKSFPNKYTPPLPPSPVAFFSKNWIPSNIWYVLLFYLVYFPLHPTRLYTPHKGKTIFHFAHCYIASS